MRLINTQTLEMKEFFGHSIPPYAILSHRWTDDEIDFKEYQKGRRKESLGYRKIIRFCKEVQTVIQLEWAWVDTVCIDKRNLAELSEAINSMFQWYRSAEVCIAYLSDVADLETSGPAGDTNSQARPDLALLRSRLRSSTWFTRGWTLQELLAPNYVLFFSGAWNFIGSKSGTGDLLRVHGNPLRSVLTLDISWASSVPFTVLNGERPLDDVSVAEKMSWLSRRSTSRVEDMAYCALGLFGIYIPLIYGEGEHAFQRLQQEIIRDSNDESIFAWSQPPIEPLCRPILASSVTDFYLCGEVKKERIHRRFLFAMTNEGLEMRLEKASAIIMTTLQGLDKVIVPLNCSDGYSTLGKRSGCRIMLEQQPCGHYGRLSAHGWELHPKPAHGAVLLEQSRVIHVHTRLSVQKACERAHTAHDVLFQAIETFDSQEQAEIEGTIPGTSAPNVLAPQIPYIRGPNTVDARLPPLLNLSVGSMPAPAAYQAEHYLLEEPAQSSIHSAVEGQLPSIYQLEFPYHAGQADFTFANLPRSG